MVLAQLIVVRAQVGTMAVLLVEDRLAAAVPSVAAARQGGGDEATGTACLDRTLARLKDALAGSVARGYKRCP